MDSRETIAQIIGIGQRLRDSAHDAGVIGPASVPEVSQPFHHVVAMLAGNARRILSSRRYRFHNGTRHTLPSPLSHYLVQQG
jgi:hypothetical protein